MSGPVLKDASRGITRGLIGGPVLGKMLAEARHGLCVHR